MTADATTGRTSVISYVPPAWLALVVVLSAYGLWTSLPLLGESDLPGNIIYFIYAGMFASLVTILWGLWLLTLAFTRTESFRRQFMVWQIAFLAWVVLREAYVLLTPEFVFSLRSTLTTVAECVVSVACIAIVRADGDGPLPVGSRLTQSGIGARSSSGRPPVIVSIAAALLGLLLGAALGFGAGLGIGVVLADVADISCFEGGCGYFAVFIGLAGLFIGAIAGMILAIWWVNRRRPSPA